MQNKLETRQACIALAKVRGHSKMSEKQEADLSTLIDQTNMSPQEIVTEVFDTPQKHLSRRIKRTKTLIASGLEKVAEKLK